MPVSFSFNTPKKEPHEIREITVKLVGNFQYLFDSIKIISAIGTLIDWTADKPEQDVPEHVIEVFDEMPSIIRDISFYIKYKNEFHFKIHWNRVSAEPYDTIKVELSKKNNHKQYESVELNHKEYLVQSNEVGRFFENVNSEFGTYNSRADVKRILGDSISNHLELRDNELSRLQQIAENLFKNFSKTALVLQRDYDEASQKRRQQLEDEFELYKKEHEEHVNKQKNDLDYFKTQLDKRKEDYDFSDNKTARRKDREKLLESIRNQITEFNLTKETQKKRTPIHVFVFTILAVLIFFNIHFGIETLALINIGDKTGPQSSELLLSLIRQLFAMGGFGSLVVFYLRWQNAWFQKHADEEFRLKRLELDFERANWIVETVHEWQNEKSAEIPKDLIDRLTGNLFVDNVHKMPEHHPADMLASALLGQASKLELAVGDSRLSFNDKGLKNLNKPQSEKNDASVN